MSGIFDGEVETALVQTIEPISTSPLYVNVDFLDLLEHCDRDEGRAFEMLGKLKDLLA